MGIKKWIVIVGWLSVVGAIIVAIYLQRISGWELSFDQFFGAFLGAFLAYAFVRLGDFVALLYQRQVKSLNGLVDLEHQLNVLIDEIGNVDYTIRGLLGLEARLTEGPSVRVDFTRVKELPFNPRPLLDLLNTEFINDVLELSADLSRLNSDLGNLNEFHKDIRDGLRTRTSTVDEYKANYRAFCTSLRTSQSFLGMCREKTIRALVLVRLQIKTGRPLLSKIIQFISRVQFDERLLSQFESERKKLEAEISETSERSREEIDRLMAAGEVHQASAEQGAAPDASRR